MLAFDLMKDDLQQLNQLIRTRLHSDVALVSQVAEYIISAGGKRLRPLLVMLSAKAIGLQSPHVNTLAAVVEFIHNATLLHDDVVDESDLRRGRKTAHTVFGNAASVLVGDFLYSRAFELMVEPQNMAVMALLAKTTNQIAEGEVWQLMNIADIELSEADYLKVIGHKTATLFSAACQLPALLLESSQTHVRLEQQALADYGLNLGLSFQIMDDYLDYAGQSDQTGKTLGQDLFEGKLTLPILWVLQHGEPPLKQRLVDHIQRPEESSDLSSLIFAITQTKALDYTRQRAQYFADQAVAALNDLSDNDAKRAMIELAQFNVSRQS